jgi:hypothetical protein
LNHGDDYLRSGDFWVFLRNEKATRPAAEDDVKRGVLEMAEGYVSDERSRPKRLDGRSHPTNDLSRSGVAFFLPMARA